MQELKDQEDFFDNSPWGEDDEYEEQYNPNEGDAIVVSDEEGDDEEDDDVPLAVRRRVNGPKPLRLIGGSSTNRRESAAVTDRAENVTPVGEILESLQKLLTSVSFFGLGGEITSSDILCIRLSSRIRKPLVSTNMLSR